MKLGTGRLKGKARLAEQEEGKHPWGVGIFSLICVSIPWGRQHGCEQIRQTTRESKLQGARRCCCCSRLQDPSENKAQDQALSLVSFKLAPVLLRRQISYYKNKANFFSKIPCQMSGQKRWLRKAYEHRERDTWLSLKRHKIQIMLTNTLWANRILSAADPA